MTVIADIFLGVGALGAAFYCLVLARRLNRFNDLETGVGGAVAVLSAQVDDLTKTLAAAQSVSEESGKSLAELTGKAEEMAGRLELMLAAMHDLPQESPVQETEESEASAPASSPPANMPMFTRHPRNQRAFS